MKRKRQRKPVEDSIYYYQPKRLRDKRFNTYEDFKNYMGEDWFRFEEDIEGLRLHCNEFADMREDIYKLYRKLYYRHMEESWGLEIAVDVVEMIDEEFYDRSPRKWSLNDIPLPDIVLAIKGQ
eukprot:50616-Eustigmatos_ZCMA.PRE.1